MTLVFTICSSNYLAHAKVLGDSLAESNPDCRFVIGLVDTIPTEIDLSAWMSHEVIPVTEIGIADFDALCQKYNIVELNTAVKPFYMEYFYKQDAKTDHVIYFDPDILVLNSLFKLRKKLDRYQMIVTPHICTYDDSETNQFYEILMLFTGVYNLGFIATARGSETNKFLLWWQKRLREHCYYLTRQGLFVDQIWVTIAPLYFNNFYVEKNPGYNMAYWNHFERSLSFESGQYLVNNDHDLIFYHFSNYNVDFPDKVTNRDKHPSKSFDERPDLRPLYDEYREKLINAGIGDVRNIECSYMREVEAAPVIAKSPRVRANELLFRLLGVLPRGLRSVIGRIAGAVLACCRKHDSV